MSICPKSYWHTPNGEGQPQAITALAWIADQAGFKSQLIKNKPLFLKMG